MKAFGFIAVIVACFLMNVLIEHYEDTIVGLKNEIASYALADSLRQCFEARPLDTIFIDTCYGYYAKGRRWYGRGFYMQKGEYLKFYCGDKPRDTVADSLKLGWYTFPDGRVQYRTDDSLVVRDANGITYEVDTNVWQRKHGLTIDTTGRPMYKSVPFMFTDSGLDWSALPFLFTDSGRWIFSLKKSTDCEEADWRVPVPAVMYLDGGGCGGWQSCGICRAYIRNCVDSAFTGDSSTILITSGSLTGKTLRVLEWVQRPTMKYSIGWKGGNRNLILTDEGAAMMDSVQHRWRWSARVEVCK